jgi:hypothetical protein
MLRGYMEGCMSKVIPEIKVVYNISKPLTAI